jgi:hypothetical protein
VAIHGGVSGRCRAIREGARMPAPGGLGDPFTARGCQLYLIYRSSRGIPVGSVFHFDRKIPPQAARRIGRGES